VIDTTEVGVEAVDAPSVGRRLLAYAPILVAAGLLALVPVRYHESGSMMRVLTEGMLFAAYAIAFNVIFGSTGQLFLCTGALAGVGGQAGDGRDVSLGGGDPVAERADLAGDRFE